MNVLETLSCRNYSAGYVLKKEMWSAYEGDTPTEMHSAYTPSGDYIGDTKTGYRLCKIRGIAPEKRTPESNVCSIGFCEKEQKWYGWSHRAIYGFGIGSKTERGDCSYHPVDEDDFLQDMIRFWDDERHIETKGEHTVEDGVKGVNISWKYDDKVQNESLRGTINGIFQVYPDSWGRGEWEAKTLEDAKQMACDFADGVS